MEKTFVRDSKGVLINNNSTAYSARLLAKKRSKNQQRQEDEIQSLKTQLEELKEIVNTLTLDK
tara:strand:+ start:1114 stop:1302 length:189 start_codon:yes stop_codon:yes gene_type:complete